MIRKTKGLVALEQYIKTAHSPVSSADVLSHIAKSGMAVNRATVFRIISRLLERGEIYEVNLGDNRKRYEWNGEHHHHLVCTNCRRIESIHACDAEKMALHQARAIGFQIIRHSLEFFGLCKRCRKTTEIS